MSKISHNSVIPKWKYWLSHFFELHIESAPSEMNPHLYVSLNKGRLQLCSANAIYSFEDLYDNFSKTFDKFKEQFSIGKKVLILGFGLGSVPIILEKKYGAKFRFTGVELDESVVYLANKYALTKIESPVEVIIAPAGSFVRQTEEKYDLIAMDVFLDDKIPEQLESEEYLEQLNSLLTPDGVLLYNRLALSESDLDETKTFYENTFLKVFSKGTVVDVDGNWMLVNRKDIFKQKK